MSISLERVLEGEWGGIDRNFRSIAQLAIDTGGKDIGVRYGVGTVTWPGGTQFTGVVTIPHGLGKTPVDVLVTPKVTTVAGYTLWAATFTATTFQVAGWTMNAAPGAGTTDLFSWLVIG